MSAVEQRVCDGCGLRGEQIQLTSLAGHVGLDYCQPCVETVENFLKELDELHTRVAEQWVTELEALRKRFPTIKELPY